MNLLLRAGLPSASCALHNSLIGFFGCQAWPFVPGVQRLPAAASGLEQQCLHQQQQHRRKHTVRMVLLKDLEKLGKQGDIVTVKAGHARYTLFPSGQADYAIPSVLQDLKARNLLSQQALQQLQAGFQESRSMGPTDPSTLPAEQQLPRIVQLLSSKPLVVSRRANLREPERPMLGHVTANHLAGYAAKQLQIELPPELILMDKSMPIQQFGNYKVPLNMRDSRGQQVELSVIVQQTHRSSKVRQLKLFMRQPPS